MSTDRDSEDDRRAYLEQLIMDPEAQLMVERLAKRTLRLHGCLVPYHDLFQLGQEGLSESAPRFDPGRGTDFPDFAWGRCYGLMTDAVADETEYQKAANHGAYLALESERDESDGARDASERDAALHAFSDRLLSGATIGLCGAITRRVSEAGEAEVVRYEACARLVRALQEEMPELPSPPREVLRMHYFEDRQLKQIMAILELRNYMHVRREHQEGLRLLAVRLQRRQVTAALLAEAEGAFGTAFVFHANQAAQEMR